MTNPIHICVTSDCDCGMTRRDFLRMSALSGAAAASPLLFAGWGLDGPPRVAQIWPYASLAARAEARSQSVKDGAWPAKGGPDWLTPEMTSAIALPLPFSPLQ